MTTNSLLQNRINELNSGILNFIDQKVRITGFYNAERLHAHLEKNIENWSSKGQYSREDITYFNIKDHALFLVYESGNLVAKYQFIPLYKELANYKNKTGTATIVIRKNAFGPHYHLMVGQTSHEFHTKDALMDYLQMNFKNEIAFT